jgi:hypothetical protein
MGVEGSVVPQHAPSDAGELVGERRRQRDARLVTAIDELNAKFGKGAITYGAAAAGQTSKIAFQRVPKVKEF